MRSKIKIIPYKEEYKDELLKIWQNQYRAALSRMPILPNIWKSQKKEIEAFFQEQSNSEHFAVALQKDKIIGYMLFQVFPFHGENTAFCPIIGHAEKTFKRVVVEKLYQYLSEKLVVKGILDHCITYFCNEKVFEETIFALGFGMIVIDAFRNVSPIKSRNPTINIVKATRENIFDVKALGEESHRYYISAPIFLNLRSKSQDYYQNLLDDKDIAIFLAFIRKEAIGFMSVRKNKEPSLIDLRDSKTGIIDEVGAYIKPAYRGKGIGASLLSKCVEWCQLNDIVRVHVDFESANTLGRPFWLSFFTETMRSARRAIYVDVAHTK